MISEQRVLHQATDISLAVNDYRTGTYTFPYIAGQYLYIGSIAPFNNLWLELGVVNAVAATVSVDMWWGNNQWAPAVDVIDETSGLTATGRLRWNTSLDKGWSLEQRASDVTGLTASIYNMYWLRLSWSATLTATMTLKYVGQKFSSDSILASFYPDLSLAAIKTAFGAGKTTWDEQHYMAAEHILRDLRRQSIIDNRGQLLNCELFTDAACHKVAELIYAAMGKPYADNLTLARAAYKEAINIKYFDVDHCHSGRLDPASRNVSTGYMSR